MRFILLLMFMVVMQISTVAQTGSRLIIYSEEGLAFTMYMNGVRQNETPKANVVSEWFEGERAGVRIDFENIGVVDIKDFIDVPFGYTATYSLRKNKSGFYKLKYLTQVNGFEGKYSDGSETDESIVMEKDGNAEMGKEEYQNSYKSSSNESFSVTTKSSEIKISIPSVEVTPNESDLTQSNPLVKKDEGPIIKKDEGLTRTRSTSTGFVPNGKMCSATSLTEEGYTKIKLQIRDKYISYDKEKIALEAIEKYCIWSEQAAGIVKLMPNEKMRMSVARRAYTKTFDTENFEVVIKSFTKELDQIELREFCRSIGSNYFK